MTTVNQYQLWCVSEAAYVTKWDTVPPTTCPNDPAHTIDPSSVVIISSISDESQSVVTSSVGTNNFWKADCHNYPIAAGPGVDTIIDLSYPYSVSVRGSTFYMTADNVGDILTVYAAPNTVVGAITSDVTIGDTVINVTPAVTSNVYPGFLLHLTDGVNSSNLGEVVSIDKVNNTVTVSVASNQNYSAASPTLVQFTMVRISNMTIAIEGPIKLGQSELGGTIVPAGTVIRAIYTNQTADAKNLNVVLELFY